MTPKIFLLCAAAGIVCGATEGLLSPLRKSAGVVFTIITDVIIAFAFVALHAVIMYFYCDGRIFAYAVICQIFGFLTARISAVKLLSPLLDALRKKTSAKKTTNRGKPLA